MNTINNPDYQYSSAEYETPDYLFEPVARALAKRRADGWTDVLELGCGSGYTASRLAAQGFQVTAIDTSQSGIALARSTYGQSGVRYELASVYDREMVESFGRFDAVFAIEVIEHMQLPRALFARAAELLRPGGRLILTTPYHGYLKNLALSLTNGWDHHISVHWDTGHLRFFSPRTLAAMASEAGFDQLGWRGLGRLPGLWKSFLWEGEIRAR